MRITHISDVVPSGRVLVYDIDLDKNVPVPGVRVSMRQILISSSAETDENGAFRIPYGFDTSWGSISVRVIFENSNIVLHGENGDDWFQFITSAYYTPASISPSSCQGIDFKISGNSRETRMALVMVAHYNYRKYCNSEGIIQPLPLNVWLLNGVSGGMTLMGRYMMSNLTIPISLLVGGTGHVPAAFCTLIGGQIISSLCPDIILGTEGLVYRTHKKNERLLYNNYSVALTGCAFHEFSHASHFTGIDGMQNRCNYWFNEYLEMGGGFISKWFNGESAFSDPYVDSPRIQLIETWGNFVHYYLSEKYFGKENLERNLENVETKKPSCKEHLIVPKGMYYLIDNEKNISVGDYCSGFTLAQLSTTLKNENVNSLYSFAKYLSANTKKDNVSNIYNTLLHGRTLE